MQVPGLLFPWKVARPSHVVQMQSSASNLVQLFTGPIMLSPFSNARHCFCVMPCGGCLFAVLCCAEVCLAKYAHRRIDQVCDGSYNIFGIFADSSFSLLTPEPQLN